MEPIVEKESGGSAPSRTESPSGSHKEIEAGGKAHSEPTSSSSQTDIVIDEKEEKRLVRFLDIRILPVVSLAYFFMFLDRTVFGNANSAGMGKALQLGTYDYNIGVSVYFLFYLVTDLSAGLLVKRFGSHIVPWSIVTFGIVTLGTTWIKNRADFFAVRVLLGITEGLACPGIAYTLARYYRRKELTLRVGTYMLTAAGVSQAFGSLLAAGLLDRGDIGSVSGWRKLFLVEGILSIGVGLILVYLWPRDPPKTKMLSEAQRELAIARIFADTPAAVTATEASTFKLVLKALRSPVNIVCTIAYIIDNMCMQGLALFIPIVLRTNYPRKTTVQIQLLAAPITIVGAVTALIAAWSATKFKRHCFSVAFGAICGIAGYGIWLGSDSAAAEARYGGLYLVAIAGYINGPVVFGWALSNASPATVRAMTASMIPAIGGLGSIASPWAYISTTAPGYYKEGNSTNIALQSLLLLLTLGLALFQYRENKKREAGERDYRLEKSDVQDLGFHHPSFRYIY